MLVYVSPSSGEYLPRLEMTYVSHTNNSLFYIKFKSLTQTPLLQDLNPHLLLRERVKETGYFPLLRGVGVKHRLVLTWLVLFTDFLMRIRSKG